MGEWRVLVKTRFTGGRPTRARMALATGAAAGSMTKRSTARQMRRLTQAGRRDMSVVPWKTPVLWAVRTIDGERWAVTTGRLVFSAMAREAKSREWATTRVSLGMVRRWTASKTRDTP